MTPPLYWCFLQFPLPSKWSQGVPVMPVTVPVESNFEALLISQIETQIID